MTAQTPQQQYKVFEQVSREEWASAEQRLFAGWKQGRRTQYQAASRTDTLCIEIHKPPNVNGVIELFPISNTGKIDKDHSLPFDVVVVFLHKSQLDVNRYVSQQATIKHLCESATCANSCHIALDTDLVWKQRQDCNGRKHTLDSNPVKTCSHLPKCFFPLA